ERVLRARGIRPLSRESREKALQYVIDFNDFYGTSVYPRVVDTEHRLQKDKGSYILHGVVDVIATSSIRTSSRHWGEHEIWDYKGTKFPSRKSDLENYEFQMRVYAHLYKIRNGTVPRKAILWFLGEMPESQQDEVSLSQPEIDAAVKVFEDTVAEIEKSIVR